MEIIELAKEKYKGYRLESAYSTSGYYDVTVGEGIFSITLELKHFEQPVPKQFSGELFEDFFEEAKAYGLADGETLVAYLEVNLERWSNRLRITNLMVTEPYRGRGYASALLGKAKELARENKIREVVLETQSCNYPAIQTYLKNGFHVNGIDLSCYTNDDIGAREVRLELAYRD